MDSLDATLLRALLRDGVYGFTGVDPRLTVSELASTSGITRNAVRERLKRWKTTGFQSGTAVFANPDLFGLHFEGQYIQLRDPRKLPRVTEALVADPTVFLAYEFESPLGKEPMVSTVRVVPDRPAPGSAVVFDTDGLSAEPAGPPFPIRFPRSSYSPSALDWKLFRAYREDPDRSCRAIARELGVPERRVRRHFAALLDGNAMFFVPLHVMAHARGSVLLIAAIVNAGEKGSIAATIQERFPNLIKLFPEAQLEDIMPPAPDGTKLSTFACLLPVRIGQLAAEVTGVLTAVPGVYQVSVGYPIRSLENRQCFDRLFGLADGSTHDDS